MSCGPLDQAESGQTLKTFASASDSSDFQLTCVIAVCLRIKIINPILRIKNTLHASYAINDSFKSEDLPLSAVQFRIIYLFILLNTRKPHRLTIYTMAWGHNPDTNLPLVPVWFSVPLSAALHTKNTKLFSLLTCTGFCLREYLDRRFSCGPLEHKNRRIFLLGSLQFAESIEVYESGTTGADQNEH